MATRRSLLVGLVAAAAFGLAAGLLSEWAIAASTGQIREGRTAGAQRAAVAGAAEISGRVIGAQRALSSAAQGLLVQYGAARKDKAVLGGILADLRPLVGSPADVHSIFVIDQSGALLAADPPSLEVLDILAPGGAWSAQAREGRPSTSDVYTSRSSGDQRAVVVAVPVRDGFGQPAGALAAAINVSRASEWPAAVAGADATVRLLDDRGALIAGAGPGARPGALVATGIVDGLGWRLEVAVPGDSAEQELAPLRAASRGLVLVLVVVAFLAGAALSRGRGRLRRAQADRARDQEAIAAAGRQRAVFLDRFGQSLRTPLNSIVGFSGLLEEHLAPTGATPQGRWLRNIRAETAQLVSLTSDACDLSLFDAGDVELRPREIAIGELMTPVEDAADEAAAAREVSFSHEAHDNVVSLDVERVRRIVGAVVDRAIRRAPAGGRVLMTARRDGDVFELAVESAGPGLQAEHIGSVREALAGLPDPSEEPGSGLALAVAARLAALHGGSISYAESDARTGAFLVRIPRVA